MFKSALRSVCSFDLIGRFSRPTYVCHGFAMRWRGTHSCHCNHFYHSCVSCDVLTAGRTTGSDCNHCTVLFAENVKIVVPITNLYKGKWEVEVGGLYVTAGPVTGKY